LNQNRNQNRRRGRGSNRGGQGGNQGNRIDSRARGNAPQMLEKYRKLAHDASLNGDRVQTEYYLQFADHYFRVIADMRAQKDEPQRPRGTNAGASSHGSEGAGTRMTMARRRRPATQSSTSDCRRSPARRARTSSRTSAKGRGRPSRR